MKMSGEKAIHRQELERGLLTQKISRLFLKYTIPGVAGLLFLGIQSVIDGVILGRFVGANALASVNLILPCYSLMTALSIVIGVGCQTLIGINLGRSDRQEANNAITTSFLFLGGISVLISGLIYIFAGDIARMLGANDVLVTGAVDYIRSLVPFFPLLSLMFLGDYMIKAMGHPLYAMIVMGSTVLINIGLDLLFIPVMGLGIKGGGIGYRFGLYLGSAVQYSPDVPARASRSGTKRTFPLAFGLECVIQWLFGRNIRAICRNHDFFVQYNDDAIFRRGWSRRLYGD